MDIDKLRLKFRAAENDCQACVHDFLKHEYETLLDMIADLEDKKLQYQKFFATLVATTATVSVAFLKFASPSAIPSPNPVNGAAADYLIGTLLVVSSLIGFGIVRNLASIRRFETFYAATAIGIRGLFIKAFKLEKEFGNFSVSSATDRNSSDYITIVLAAFIDLCLCISGVVLMLRGQAVPVILVALGGTTVIYLLVYYVLIENYLRHRPHTETVA